MAEDSKIGWTDHTQNFWWGCNKVSEECRFCYIATIMRRGGYGGGCASSSCFHLFNVRFFSFRRG